MCARPRAGAAKEATRGQSQLQMAQPQCSFPRWPARRALRRSTARPGVSSVLCPVAGALGASTHLHGGLGVRLRHLRHLDGKRIHDGAAHVGTDELLVHHGLEHAAPSRQAPRGQFSKSVLGAEKGGAEEWGGTFRPRPLKQDMGKTLYTFALGISTAAAFAPAFPGAAPANRAALSLRMAGSQVRAAPVQFAEARRPTMPLRGLIGRDGSVAAVSLP